MSAAATRWSIEQLDSAAGHLEQALGTIQRVRRANIDPSPADEAAWKLVVATLLTSLAYITQTREELEAPPP